MHSLDWLLKAGSTVLQSYHFSITADHLYKALCDSSSVCQQALLFGSWAALPVIMPTSLVSTTVHKDWFKHEGRTTVLTQVSRKAIPHEIQNPLGPKIQPTWREAG